MNILHSLYIASIIIVETTEFFSLNLDQFCIQICLIIFTYKTGLHYRCNMSQDVTKSRSIEETCHFYRKKYLTASDVPLKPDYRIR